MDASHGPELVIRCVSVWYNTPCNLLFNSISYRKPVWIRCQDYSLWRHRFFFNHSGSMSYKVFSKSMQHLLWVSASFTWLFILKAKSICVSFKCTLVMCNLLHVTIALSNLGKCPLRHHFSEVQPLNSGRVLNEHSDEKTKPSVLTVDTLLLLGTKGFICGDTGLTQAGYFSWLLTGQTCKTSLLWPC